MIRNITWRKTRGQPNVVILALGNIYSYVRSEDIGNSGHTVTMVNSLPWKPEVECHRDQVAYSGVGQQER